MINTLLGVTVVGLLLYSFYVWATKNNDYWAKRNVKHLRPHFLVGNVFSLMTGRTDWTKYLPTVYNTFPNEKIIGLFSFRTPALMVRDPEMIKKLTIKDFDHFQDHLPFMDERVDRLFGNSLFIMGGDRWQAMRSTLSPAFSSSKMRQMFQLVGDTAHEMVEHFVQKSRNQPQGLAVELKDLFSRYTNDVIASAAFGNRVNSFENENNEFFQMGSTALSFDGFGKIMKFLFAITAPGLMQMLGIQFSDSKMQRFFKSMVLETIDERTKRNIVRPDMINILMQLKRDRRVAESDGKEHGHETVEGFAVSEESEYGRKYDNREWSDDELVAQCFIFFLAGFDSSSGVMMFTVYELTMNADVQERLYGECAELSRRLNGARLPYDELQKMRYMDQVVSEAMRMWIPIAQTDRMCTKDYDYDDGENRFRIERGTDVWIPTYALHHDPQYFPEPSRFDPERFSDERKGDIVKGTYIPFGIGPRSCIGARFALMEVKAVIYYILLKFKFVPNSETQIPLRIAKNAGAIKPESGIHVQLVPRQ